MAKKETYNRFETLQPGISISSRYSTTGTLGLIVFDKLNNNKACILSNWHVLAKSSFIPRLSFRSGRPIYQPGRIHDGKKKSNIAGKLVRHDRSTDSAIAEIINRDYILNQYKTNVLIASARLPKVGDIVEKSGARTGVTRGRISSIIGSVVKIIPLEGSVDSSNSNLEISDGGDSGCLWYDPYTYEGLVLHNSGETTKSPDDEFAKGHLLIDILQKLDISLSNN